MQKILRIVLRHFNLRLARYLRCPKTNFIQIGKDSTSQARARVKMAIFNVKKLITLEVGKDCKTVLKFLFRGKVTNFKFLVEG